MTRFTEVADRVFVLRYPVLDVNVTLVLGDERALLVDTLATTRQARELAAAVAALTDRPLAVLNTHHHFDHCFGNAVFADAPVYAHPETIAFLSTADPVALWREWAPTHPGLDDLNTTPVRPPDRHVVHEQTLDLGGRTVLLRHPGRGHTAGDVVAHVPDVGLLVAGDLVEESGPPQFEDAYPLEWPEAVAELLALEPRVVVPGHGAVCDAAFVRGQHEELAALSWLIREAHADGAPADEVVRRCTFEFETAAVAVARGYAELDDAIL
ncbi:MBL fold metallo-hydrolase [Virgisporangium ochraceum]|uniref:MBL fold metallo-hydrolase n=1 Tax=Virgisporangium ochraceum TaxID=65505 RepID=A0A8J4A0Y6_9ACTN|nr:MBL fold metallo-hydrolase [Virgisporangium ochraceum]GIJ72023.1 MBL fold metallo-hydrolase [Virgisporangium ochraceum]